MEASLCSELKFGKSFQCVAYVYPSKCHRYDLFSFRNQNFTLFSDLQAVLGSAFLCEDLIGSVFDF